MLRLKTQKIALKRHFCKPGLNRNTMKNICAQTMKHTGLWSIEPQTPVLASFGSQMTPSIRGSYNDARMSGSFIEMNSYT